MLWISLVTTVCMLKGLLPFLEEAMTKVQNLGSTNGASHEVILLHMDQGSGVLPASQKKSTSWVPGFWGHEGTLLFGWEQVPGQPRLAYKKDKQKAKPGRRSHGEGSDWKWALLPDEVQLLLKINQGWKWHFGIKLLPVCFHPSLKFKTSIFIFAKLLFINLFSFLIL
jgi:hypothetical protein